MMALRENAASVVAGGGLEFGKLYPERERKAIGAEVKDAIWGIAKRDVIVEAIELDGRAGIEAALHPRGSTSEGTVVVAEAGVDGGDTGEFFELPALVGGRAGSEDIESGLYSGALDENLIRGGNSNGAEKPNAGIAIEIRPQRHACRQCRSTNTGGGQACVAALHSERHRRVGQGDAGDGIFDLHDERGLDKCRGRACLIVAADNLQLRNDGEPGLAEEIGRIAVGLVFEDIGKAVAVGVRNSGLLEAAKGSLFPVVGEIVAVGIVPIDEEEVGGLNK